LARSVLRPSVMRPSSILLMASVLAVVACGGEATLAAGSADGSAPCAHDSDCGQNQLCAFKATDGCQAEGHCFERLPPGPQCNAYQPGCACDGTQVGLVCGPYPSGYADRPVLHVGVCEGIDAGQGDASAGGGCGVTCDRGSVCVVTVSSGGACQLPDDAGACPPGTQKQGGCCVFSSTAYACHLLPAACGGTPSCGCASSLCSCICQGVSGNQLDCLCEAP
jgi:hypothetical protein